WKTWDEYFPLLKEFYNKRGHSDVSAKYDKDLYFFISSLRKNYRTHAIHTGNSTLKLKKDTTSKKIVRKQYRLWNEYFPKLKEFHNIHGHCNITSKDGDANKLDHFVRDLRRQYRLRKAGTVSVLTQDRIQHLEQIGFEWVKTQKYSISHEIRWNEMIENLSAFREKYGHTEVPQEYDNNSKMGYWVMNQRSFYRMNEIGIDTTLTKERIEQLEELDFTWNVYEKQWSVMFKRLVEYHKKHGHVIFESSDFVNEKLRQWLNEQRYFYR
ncbi:hypothetical protein FRACYDRAFT_160030, partial [Fragilariopsis cylindrus CCMP1102]